MWALEEHLFGLGSFLEVDLVTGLGDKIQFWQDKWCGDCSLQEWFPLPFAYCIQHDATIDFLLVRSYFGMFHLFVPSMIGRLRLWHRFSTY